MMAIKSSVQLSSDQFIGGQTVLKSSTPTGESSSASIVSGLPSGAASSAATIAGSAPSPRLVKAAHEFEAQMMKELMTPLNHGSAVGGDDSDDDAGTFGALGEFASEALGKALSESGGFGIANRIVKQLTHSARPVHGNTSLPSAFPDRKGPLVERSKQLPGNQPFDNHFHALPVTRNWHVDTVMSPLK